MSDIATVEKMKPEWEIFAAEYLVDLNATKAAIRSGYSDENNKGAAAVAGQSLLRNPNIRREIRRQLKKRLDRIEVRQDKVIRELALIAFSDVTDYDVDDVTGKLSVAVDNRQATRAVQSVKIKKRSWVDKNENPESEVTTEFKLWDKVRALEVLAKHLGLVGMDTVHMSQHLHLHKHEAGNEPITTTELAKLVAAIGSPEIAEACNEVSAVDATEPAAVEGVADGS